MAKSSLASRISELAERSLKHVQTTSLKHRNTKPTYLKRGVSFEPLTIFEICVSRRTSRKKFSDQFLYPVCRARHTTRNAMSKPDLTEVQWNQVIACLLESASYEGEVALPVHGAFSRVAKLFGVSSTSMLIIWRRPVKNRKD